MSDPEIEQLEDELESEKTKAKRLSPAEWERLKTFWELGTHSLSQLSDMFGIRADTIQRRLSADGVEKGAKAHEAVSSTVSEAQEELARQTAEHIQRVNASKDDHYKWAEAVAKLVMAEIISAKNAKTPIGLKDANIAALGKAAKTLEVIRKERFAILGLDKDDGDPEDIPELIISEMTEEQVVDLQNAMRGIQPPSDDLDLSALEDEGIVMEGDDVD